jgi:RHS repeat-associated protein
MKFTTQPKGRTHFERYRAVVTSAGMDSRQFERKALLSVVSLGIVLSPLSARAGGYVPDGGTQLKQASSIQISSSAGSVVPTFNNATLTDQNTIGETNNNVVKTPHTADPVSTVTGNNFHDETDFVIKGRAGLNYAFTRTFNSAPSATAVAGVLGNGWTHSYAMKLKSNDYGACPNCTAAQDPVNGNGKTSSITYTDERGGDHNYLVNESTYAVTAPQGEFDSMALDTPAAGQTTVTFRNGTKYVFTTVGSSNIKTTPGVTARLTQIADAWGNQLNFGYDGNGRLSTVTDNLGITGRTGLVFAYDANGNLSTIKDWAGRTWTYVVTVNGANKQLTSYTAAQAPSSGATYTYSYAPGTNNLQTIAKPLKRNGTTVSTTFAYYTNGRTFNYQDALGNIETLDYDLYRKTTRVTDPRGGIRDHEYDSSGRLTKLTEPDGGILMFANTTTDGLRYSKKDGLGYQTQYSYRSDKSFNSASDTYGNVTREQDALSNTIDTTYGVYDQVASVKDKRGNTVTTSFHTSTDSTCKLTGKPDTTSIASLTVSPGTVKTSVPLVSYCWNSDGTIKSQTDYLDPNNSAHTRVTTYTYTDTTHFLVDHISTVGWDDTGGSSTTSKYFTYETNNLGRIKTETLKRRNTPTDATQISLTTTYTYDSNDRVTQAQNAEGDLVINRYDDNGQLWQVTHQYLQTGGTYDTRNIVTRTFDAADRVATETDALSGVTTYQYDQAGNVISVKDAENHTTKYEYDAMNRRTAVVDANGNRTSTVYNLRGEVVSVTNAMGETTSFQYDALGRKTQVTDPHGYVTKFTSYDANGNLLCMVDANANASLQTKNSDGCTESRQYDELNRVTLIRDALNGTTATTYDGLSHPLTQIDAEGRQYAWAYDGLGRLSTETDFTGKTTSYSSDEAGNIWQKTNRLAEVTQSTFDKLNRPTNVLYKKDNSTETLNYDPAGTLHSAANVTTNGSVTYTFSYDNLKRLQSKSDGRGKSLSFTYDKTGNIQTKTTYQGSTTSYTYDSANRLVNASNPDYLSVNYQYDAAGRLLSRVMSSGARSIYAYDNGGWLSSLTHYDAAGNQVSTQSTNRDRLGHITTLTTAAGATNYTLDALYRLTTVAAPTAANSEAFSYDHIGNRLTATRGGTSIGATGSTTRYYNYYAATVTAAPVGLNGAYTQTYNNRLKEVRIGSASGTLDSSLTFDNEGRLTAQTGTGAKTLTWDPKSRVASVTTGSTTESYAYDPMDHRIQRSGGSLGNLSYYLEGDHLESVYSGGTLQEKYFRGSTIDELVAGYTYLSGSLTPFMFHHDQVMSVSATTKTNGGTQATQTFWAFGETQATTGTTVTRLGFTGRENDGTGLMQYRARYYDPVTGRFISEDPKKQAAGINFYAYVSNDPIDANDPSGELQFNTDGSIKFTPVDKPYPFWHASGEATIMQGGYVYANDGTPIQAYKNVGYNDHFNYDCHGMTFGNSQVWINNDQVPAILKGDSYTPITQPRLGDIVVYRDVDGVQHSATVTYIDMRTGAVSVTGKGGVTPSPETTPVKPGPDGGWYDPNATYQFYRQTTPSTPSTPQTPSQPSTGGGSGTSSVPGPKSSLDNGLDPVATSNGSVEGNSGGAAGGYLIYPNKPNNNNVLNVYRK